ncbi:MAG: hypothetical protein ACE5IZ_09985, partial [Dehalococcoidia bacterium]
MRVLVRKGLVSQAEVLEGIKAVRRDGGRRGLINLSHFHTLGPGEHTRRNEGQTHLAAAGANLELERPPAGGMEAPMNRLAGDSYAAVGSEGKSDAISPKAILFKEAQALHIPPA